MLYSDICKIITEWDPVRIADISPKDEYYGEAGQIYDHIMSNDRITPEELGEAIQKIFSDSFDELFRRSKDDCIKVAEKIMDDMWNQINTIKDEYIYWADSEDFDVDHSSGIGYVQKKLFGD